MSRQRRRVCVDCEAQGITTRRKAPHPGPRCATHHRAKKTDRRNYSHKRHVEETYGITYEQYWKIYDIQMGVCYLCERATGKKRKLSVDHDHSCCSGPVSCGKCVRGLLCRRCNTTLGHFRDDPKAFERAIRYLRDPPARSVLG